MSTYTTTKFGLTAANGDDPILNGDNQMRGLADTAETALANVIGFYKTLRAGSWAATAPAAATYVLPVGTAVPTDVQNNAFYFDPADWTVGTRTNKLRVRAQVFTNNVAPTQTFTVGLYPIATYGGTGGAVPKIASLGTVVAGSTVAVASPGATSQTQGNSGDFTAPAAGYYTLGLVIAGAPAASSAEAIDFELQLRQV